MEKPSVWQDRATVDLLDQFIGDGGDTWDMVLAQIPSLFGTSDKATYLGFRSLGFHTGQALELAKVSRMDYEGWRNNSPQIFEWEKDHLIELQQRVGADVVRLAFLRNMTLFLFKDGVTLRQAMVDQESMTDRDFSYLKVIRRHYTMADLLNLEKAIAPEKHRDLNLTLQWNQNQFEVVDGEVIKQIPEGSVVASSD